MAVKTLLMRAVSTILCKMRPGQFLVGSREFSLSLFYGQSREEGVTGQMLG